MSKEKLHLLLLEAFLRSNRRLAQQLPQAGLLPGQPKILEFCLSTTLPRKKLSAKAASLINLL